MNRTEVPISSGAALLAAAPTVRRLLAAAADILDRPDMATDPAALGNVAQIVTAASTWAAGMARYSAGRPAVETDPRLAKRAAMLQNTRRRGR